MGIKMFRIIIPVALISLGACTFSATNYIRNDTSGSLVVSATENKLDSSDTKELGPFLTIAENTVCGITTDVIMGRYLTIQNSATGQSSEIDLFERKGQLYVVSVNEDQQTIKRTIAESETKKTLGDRYESTCLPIEGLSK